MPKGLTYTYSQTGNDLSAVAMRIAIDFNDVAIDFNDGA